MNIIAPIVNDSLFRTIQISNDQNIYVHCKTSISSLDASTIIVTDYVVRFDLTSANF